MTKTSKTIVFFGNEKLATGIASPEPLVKQAITKAGFEIEQVVTGSLSQLRDHTAELAVLVSYGHIIPQSVLDQFPLGIINIHPSLLPLYRGPTPIEQVILDGTNKTGVSIMQLTSKMDEGPIYKQKTLHLSGNESKIQLASKLHELGAELLVDVLTGITENSLQPRQQPHPDRALYCAKIQKDDGIIDWAKPAQQLEREVRAYAEWPKSRTELAGKEVVITQAVVSEDSAEPGVVIAVKGKLVVGTGHKSLEILKLKPAGKPEMTAQGFLAGYSRLL